ncbi:MAG: hypothetical protein BWX72_01378 [Firmicutes bacterium ADurb.Bin080]|nr:MAG: hypothetical protein BWX72_01378 [Firmicutes bacterium ADurb.Bin080]
MTREEAEDIFMQIVLSDETGIVEMTADEFQAFSVFVEEILKDMEKQNQELWSRARNYALKYREPYASIIKDISHIKPLFMINEDGEIVEIDH